MNEGKEIPVWQLTDGTVIVQGEESIGRAIKEKQFTWQATDGVSSQRSLGQRLGHWLASLLEKI